MRNTTRKLLDVARKQLKILGGKMGKKVTSAGSADDTDFELKAAKKEADKIKREKAMVKTVKDIHKTLKDCCPGNTSGEGGKKSLLKSLAAAAKTGGGWLLAAALLGKDLIKLLGKGAWKLGKFGWNLIKKTPIGKIPGKVWQGAKNMASKAWQATKGAASSAWQGAKGMAGSVLKKVAGSGLGQAAKFAGSRALGILTGPVGWALTAGMLAYDNKDTIKKYGGKLIDWVGDKFGGDKSEKITKEKVDIKTPEVTIIAPKLKTEHVQDSVKRQQELKLQIFEQNKFQKEQTQRYEEFNDTNKEILNSLKDMAAQLGLLTKVTMTGSDANVSTSQQIGEVLIEILKTSKATIEVHKEQVNVLESTKNGIIKGDL
jgi:hypothetical protein